MESKTPGIRSFGAVKRKAITVSQDSWVKTAQLPGLGSLPLVVTPAVDGVSLEGWCQSNREWLETNLLDHGGILFRGFGVHTVEGIQQLIEKVSGSLLEYTYRSTPRSKVSGNIYTSTEYPASEVIPFHNEMSYSHAWPMKIWFYCVKVARTGGETPIADSRRVYDRISPAVRQRFAEKGVMYVRNYREGIDLPWQAVFQTDSRADVEEFCRTNGIQVEWVSEDHLRTRQVCQGVARHAKTGAMLWFNQAHLFHSSSLNPTVREALLASFSEEELPRNALYGDGSPIEAEVLEEIRDAFAQEDVKFPWQEGDLLMLDNMLVAHGRSAFEGERKIVVGMTEPFSGSAGGQ